MKKIKRKIGEIAEIIMGQSPESRYYNLRQIGLPFYQGITEFGDKYPKIKVYTTKATKVIEKGDLIFSVRAPVGAVNIALSKCCIGRGNAGLRMKNGNQEYLYYLLLANNKLINSSTSGTVFSSINKDVLSNLELEIISDPNEQTRIANILSSFDEKIEILKKENKILEEISQNIFKRWFIDFNFPDKDGKPYKDNGGKMIESELGIIPDTWTVGSLRDITNIFDTKRIPLASEVRAKRPGVYPYYGATNVMDYIDDYIFDTRAILLAEDGSVTDANGYPILQFVEGKYWVSNHAHVLTGKLPWSTELVYELLKRFSITNIITGAVQPKINQNNLLNSKVVMPKKMDFENDINVFKNIRDKIFENKNQVTKNLLLRDILLKKLIP